MLCECVGAGLFACGAAGAQTEVYVTVTEVKVEPLSNATRVTIRTDGMVQGAFNRADFEAPEGNWAEPRQLRVFPFRLTNARTALGSFVDIGAYPVSHLSFSIPPESREGVGLDVQLVLYKRGYMDLIYFQGEDYFSGWVPAPPGVWIQLSRDGRDVIITVTSDRYREAEAPRTEVAPSQSSLSVSVDENGRLTVRALNSTLGEVLGEISDKAGLPIAVRGGANYRASMSVTQVAPEDLMRAIARAYGLSVRSVGGIYYVTEGLPTEVDSYWAAPTAGFRLLHMPAEEAIELLPDFLLRYVRADPGQNALIATGPPQLLDKLDADLRAVDQPRPQIRLSATVVEEVTEGGLEAASELVYAGAVYRFTTSADTGRLSYEIASEPLHDLRVKLRALVERGCVRTRVCPMVTVVSGRHGEIFLGRRQYFAFAQTNHTGWGAVQEVALESADVGSRIMAEPWSGDGEHITVFVRVQANTILTVDSQGLPLVATRSAQGTVRLTSGDTIIFGGLVLESSSNTHRQAGPKALPVIGALGGGHKQVTGTTKGLVLLTMWASYDVRDFAAPEEQLTKGGVG